MSIKIYIVGLVVVFVTAVGIGTTYERFAADHDAGKAALQDARFAAALAARDTANAVGLIRSTVEQTATSPAILQSFSGGSGCTTNFGLGAGAGGHLDVIASNGTVACSSLPHPTSSTYAGAPWLSGALASPMFSGPVVDARTGKLVAFASAPVPGRGAVVAFFELARVGPQLGSTYGGPRHLEFVVTNRAGTVVVARSVHPQRWVGAQIAGTAFGRGVRQAERPDLEGTPRLYGEATARGLDWRFFAGADKADTLAAARRLSDRELLISLAGLLVFLAAALVIYRRIAMPIRRLSRGVGDITRHVSAGPLGVSGPSEVVALGEDFNSLLAAADRELIAISRLAAIVESSDDAIVSETLSGVITSWNSGAERMYGYMADEVVGQNISLVVHEERVGELGQTLEGVSRGERIVPYETQRVRKDGIVLDVSVTVSPIRDASGAVVGASVVGRDITERKREDAQRRSLEERLHQSQRLESLGQLAGGVAHDFNNLLAVILNYATFVAEETGDNEAVRSDVEQIRAAAERAARLTKQLLIFGRREQVRPEVLDLNALVADVHHLLDRSIGEHVRLAVRPADVLPPVRADRGQMEQVLLNLAVNARDAMPTGGVLTIATSVVELDEAYTGLHPEVVSGSYVELCVSDTGVGMTAEISRRVFEPFFSTKPKGEGSGLGLATVYGIVSEAGGGVSVYSEPGVGTTFRVFFPAMDRSATTPQQSPEPAVRGGANETILVVEDEPAVLEVTSRILRRNGYSVLEAARWDTALSLAADNEFQLLLTDSVMPEVSGSELAARLLEGRPELSVLFMSGYSDGVLGPRRVLPEGVELIQKPFNESSLLAKVRAVIDAGPSQQSPSSPDPSASPI